MKSFSAKGIEVMKINKRGSFALLSLMFVFMGMSVVTPALQNIAEAFPKISFTNILLVNTLPVLPMIPVSIIAGILAGSRIKYKTLVMVGLSIYVIAGMIPVFMNDFVAVLASRAFFGVGLGIISPLGNALILNIYGGQKRATMLGIGGAVTSVGGIVLQLLGSILCSINWHYTFVAYALGIIALIIVFLFLPEPVKSNQQRGGKISIPGLVYIVCILYGVVVLLIYPVLLNMSTIIIAGNLGAVTLVGFVLSMFTVGGTIAGAIFGKVFRLAGKFTLSIGLMLFVFSLGIIYYGDRLILLTIGTTLMGVALGFTTPSITKSVGEAVSPASHAAAMGIFVAVMNIGLFLTSYYMAGLTSLFGNTSPKFPIFVSMIVFAVSTLIIVMINLMKTGMPKKVLE